MTKEKDPEYYHNSLELYSSILDVSGNPNQRKQNKAIAEFLREVSLVLRDREAERAILYADQRAMVNELEILRDENIGLSETIEELRKGGG